MEKEEKKEKRYPESSMEYLPDMEVLKDSVIMEEVLSAMEAYDPPEVYAKGRGGGSGKGHSFS